MGIRRLYQEAQKGKFSTPVLKPRFGPWGCFVGTVVELSIGEHAVVVMQHPEIGLKPLVKIFLGSDGTMLDRSQVCDLFKDASLEQDVSIATVLLPTECSLDLQEPCQS